MKGLTLKHSLFSSTQLFDENEKIAWRTYAKFSCGF